jgi:DNA-binding MarR family transcriptional regulator
MSKEIITQIIERRRRLDRIIRERTMDPWTTLSLTVTQLRSLFYINRNGSVNLSGLASAFKVTPANVTGIVDRLVEHNLLTRVPDPNDRRVLWLNLTDKAKSLIDELREGRASEMRKILEKLPGEDLEAVSRSYGLLIQAAEAVKSHGDDEGSTRRSESIQMEKAQRNV